MIGGKLLELWRCHSCDEEHDDESYARDCCPPDRVMRCEACNHALFVRPLRDLKYYECDCTEESIAAHTYRQSRKWLEAAGQQTLPV